MLGLAVNQILFAILAIVASTLPQGSVTIFQFAFNLEYFPIGIIAISFAVASFPLFFPSIFPMTTSMRFDRCFHARREILLMIPLSILFLVLQAQLVRLVVSAGNFDWTATIQTADALAFLLYPSFLNH